MPNKLDNLGEGVREGSKDMVFCPVQIVSAKLLKNQSFSVQNKVKDIVGHGQTKQWKNIHENDNLYSVFWKESFLWLKILPHEEE